jgi:DNA-damage-inducible protein D
MNTNITTQQNNFESIKHVENNTEFWLARELQSLLGYKRWEDFHKLIQNTQNTDFEGKIDHIRHSPKLITAGKGATREIDDYILTRFGCYKISMLGHTQECIDSRSYFAIQARKQEIAEQNINHQERQNLRRQSKESYKSYNSILVENGVNEGQVGIITAMGDKALFGQKTAKIKADNNIPNDRPLEDFLHPANVTARMLGREMTKLKVESNQIKTLGSAISNHTKHNKEIRQVLIENQIQPESLPILEDIKANKNINLLNNDSNL